MKAKWLYIFLMLMFTSVYSQTLIINEFSNGPTGSQEYVEFLVVDNSIAYDCNNTTPPCIDIRGWIFDDNSGYHGTSGQAAGAVRFTNDPIWSCVPLGTIILVYNGLDPNISLPADDFSMTDGNCSLVIPLNNLTYFEFTETTPGAASCSYPTTGWGTDPSPTWSNVGMSNGGDCARIVDLAGCEVFSVCYGSCNQNNMIYFSGSGSDDVWSFNGGDPAIQSNWTEGCAGDISACGSDDQTPGAPNNTANAAYIAQFNNNCQPITPLTSSLTNSSVCGCTNTATVTGSGSIPGYTYEWYEGSYANMISTNAMVTNLCNGLHIVVTTSAIGCQDTLTVTIGGASVVNAGTDVTLSLCANAASINLLDSLGGNPDSGGSWIGPSTLTNGDQGTFSPTTNTTGTYGYVVLGSGGCPNDTGFVNITVGVVPNAGTNGVLNICESSVATDLFSNLGGNPSAGGSWSPTLTSGTNMYDPSQDNAGTYTYTLTGLNGCPNSSADVVVTQTQNPIITESITTISCFGAADGEIDLTINPPTGTAVNWLLSNGGTSATEDVAALDEGWQFYTVTTTNGCIVIDSLNLTEPLPLSVNYIINAESCIGACDGQINATATNGLGTVSYSLDGVNFVAGPFTGVCGGNYTITAQDANGCSNVSNITVATFNTNNQPIITSVPSLCINDSPLQLQVDIAGGTWSGFGITDPNLGTFSPSQSGVGNYNIIYTLNSACGGADTVLITINDVPSGSFTISDTLGCSPLPVSFVSTVNSGTTFTCEWNFGDGITNSNCGTVNYIYGGVGCFDPTLQITDANGCVANFASPSQICTLPLADASFTVTPGLSLNEFSSGILAENITPGINSYMWTIDGDNIGVQDAVSYNFTDLGEGTYELCLHTNNVAGCEDSACVELVFQGAFALYIPNTFTPNGSGLNDTFGPVFYGDTPESFSFLIFNRWGQVVFESSDIYSLWDGTFKSLPAQEDVYLWRMEYKQFNNVNIIQKRGHVTLLR